jgi:hypothetical protein
MARFGPAASPQATALWTLAALSLIALLVCRHQRTSSPFDGWAQGAMMARLGTTTYERNLPIAAPKAALKSLITLYDVYIHDQLLARNGRLPNYAEARKRYKSLTYIVKDPRAYPRDGFARLLDAGCVLQLRRGSRGPRTRGFVDTKLTQGLPATCDTLLASLAKANERP